jgi:hypothetical protein
MPKTFAARRGRPPEGREAKLSHLSLRISKETRRRLEAAANRSGRSLNQEAELRLMASLTAPSTMATVFAILDAMAPPTELSATQQVRAFMKDLLNAPAGEPGAQLQQEVRERMGGELALDRIRKWLEVNS